MFRGLVRSSLAAVAVACLASEAGAVLITPPPVDWVFQNTQAITATDFRVVRANPLPGQPALPDIDPIASSGGAAFPNKDIMGNVAVYTGPPGIPSGGFYAHSFPNWPAGTTFSVLFSYNDDEFDLRQPGRVFRRVAGAGFNFELVPSLSPAGPLTGPAPDFAALFQVRGMTVAVPEPSSVVLVGLGVLGGAGFGWRRRRASTT